MRIIVATAKVPFIHGGAEVMTSELVEALIQSGHEAEVVSLPFRFRPHKAVSDNIDMWKSMDLGAFDVGAVDRIIALKFPAFNLRHPQKIVWLMHQHRSVYELFDTPYGESSSDEEVARLRKKIFAADFESLSEAKALFTISRTVSNRLEGFNRLASEPLYQPPAMADLYRPGPVFPYIYCPSRLERLKRQDLLIQAMKYVSEPVVAVIAGEGGMYQQYRELALSLGLERRVRFVGRVSDVAMRDYYSNSLAVFFGPMEEDYGFITLEAMLSAKPVITCADSGGPTEFIVNEETGFIANPDPREIAGMINRLWSDKRSARQMGQNGRAHYRSMGISWENVVEKLLGV